MELLVVLVAVLALVLLEHQELVVQEILHQHHHHKVIMAEIVQRIEQWVVEEEQVQLVQMVLMDRHMAVMVVTALRRQFQEHP
jgi:hypothetical protein